MRCRTVSARQVLWGCHSTLPSSIRVLLLSTIHVFVCCHPKQCCEGARSPVPHLARWPWGWKNMHTQIVGAAFGQGWGNVNAEHVLGLSYSLTKLEARCFLTRNGFCNYWFLWLVLWAVTGLMFFEGSSSNPQLPRFYTVEEVANRMSSKHTSALHRCGDLESTTGLYLTGPHLFIYLFFTGPHLKWYSSGFPW